MDLGITCHKMGSQHDKMVRQRENRTGCPGNSNPADPSNEQCQHNYGPRNCGTSVGNNSLNGRHRTRLVEPHLGCHRCFGSRWRNSLRHRGSGTSIQHLRPLAEPPFVSGRSELPSRKRTAPTQPESEAGMNSMGTDHRLIEDWLPVNEISVEAVREGAALAGHPPVNQLHVWWARRPLIVSRAAVAASILPQHTSHAEFIRNIGTSPDVVSIRRQMDEVKATGQWSNISFPDQRSFLHNPKFLVEESETAPIPVGRHCRRRVDTIRSRALRDQNHRQRTEPGSWAHPSRHLRMAPELRLGNPGKFPRHQETSS